MLERDLPELRFRFFEAIKLDSTGPIFCLTLFQQFNYLSSAALANSCATSDSSAKRLLRSVWLPGTRRDAEDRDDQEILNNLRIGAANVSCYGSNVLMYIKHV